MGKKPHGDHPQTAGPVDKVQYHAQGDEEWKSAAGENGVYTFVLTESSNEVVTYEVRALNTKDKQESKTVEVQVGKIDATAPWVDVQTIENDHLYVQDTTTWKVTIRDEQSGLNKDEIRIRAFYSEPIKRPRRI